MLSTADHDVERFEVAMNYTLMMRRTDTGAYRRHQIECAFGMERSFAGEQIVKRLALDVLHYEKRQCAVDHPIIGYRNNVRVADRGGGERLLTKARHELRIVSNQIRQDDLYRELRL